MAAVKAEILFRIGSHQQAGVIVNPRTSFYPSHLELQSCKSYKSSKSGSVGRRCVVHASFAAARFPHDSAEFEREEARRRSAEMARDAVRRTVEVIEDVKLHCRNFDEATDLSGKAKSAVEMASDRLEEAALDVQRVAGSLDRRFKVTDKTKSIIAFATLVAQNLEQQCQLKQRMYQSVADLKIYLPKIGRIMNGFKRTPFCQAFIYGAISWLFISGWLARVFFWTVCITPFLPFAVQTVAKAVLTEGRCESCGHRFIGPRSETLACRHCKKVVWKPKARKVEPTAMEVIDVNPLHAN